jgi:hypothetical protein
LCGRKMRSAVTTMYTTLPNTLHTCKFSGFYSIKTI